MNIRPVKKTICLHLFWSKLRHSRMKHMSICLCDFIKKMHYNITIYPIPFIRANIE